MMRREYLAAVATGTAAGTAGCFWEDNDSNTRLGRISVSNYYERPHRFVVHVEENGEDAVTTEFELEGGGNNPTPRKIDCGWSTEPGSFTVHILQLTEPTATTEVSIPDDRPKNEAAGDCVGVELLAGYPLDSAPIAARATPCEEMADDIEFCVDVG